MSYTATEIQTFLGQQTPFRVLTPTALADVVGQIRPLRYRMGQTLLLKDKLPHQVIILYEGQVRLLGYDPTTKMPATLELLSTGAMIGWMGLVRGIPCETAIASVETIGLTLTIDQFWQLLDRYPLLAREFHEQTNPAEVFDLLSHQTLPNVEGPKALRKLVSLALPTAHVCSLRPGQHNLRELAILQEPGRTWFVSGGSEVKGQQPNQTLDVTAELTHLDILGQHPSRLVGLTEIQLLTPSKPKLSKPTPTTVLAPDTVVTTKKDAPLETIDVSPDVPFAPEVRTVATPPPPRLTSDDPSTRKGVYPLVKAGSGLDAAIACFQMIGQYFQIPFRREAISRVLNDQMQRHGEISLYNGGAVAELMGLNAQLVTIPARSLAQIQVPAIVRWQESLAIIYEVSDRQIVIGSPELGILRRSINDFTDTWDKIGQVLLLQPSKHTPTERFGLSWFWPVIKKYKIVLLEVFVASFFVQAFALANPLVVQVLIDKVIVQGSKDTLQFLGFLLLGVAVFEFALSTARTYLFVDTTNRIDMSLGSTIIDHLLRLPLGYFDRRPVGELSSRVNELENIRNFLTGTALNVVLDGFFSVIYIVVMLIYSWKLTLLSLATVPFFIGLTIFFSPIIRRQLRGKAERNAQTQSHLVEVVGGIQTVKAQNIELRSRWRWQEYYARYVAAGFKTVQTSALANSASNFLSKVSGLLVLWGGSYLVIEGELSLGELIAFRIIASYVTNPLLRIAQLWQNFQEVGLSLERLADIVDTPQEGETDAGNIPMPAIKGHVQYENVAFRFKPNGPLQLVKVNLDIPAGEFVGIVGRSGAGKSTLTKLLVRLYDWETGRILIDGYDVAKVELYSLRRQVGVVPQDPLLFDGTIQENIAMHNPEATSQEIIMAAQVAAAHEFIMELPSGYNTRVGERGASLSGGQRQRIAIARTVLQQPSLLILDEATSALDYPTERKVCTNLSKAFGNRTVLFITHRLRTVQSADRIVMMDAGAVVEQGSHEELMALRGRYFALSQQQDLNSDAIT